VTGADVLVSLNVEVDNLQEFTALLGDMSDQSSQCSIIEIYITKRGVSKKSTAKKKEKIKG